MENCSEDDIVISGIAGRFPESDGVQELWNNLMSGVELSSIDERRWPLDVFDIPKRSAKIKHLEKFDADFFQVKDNSAHTMDPQIRLLLETTWEAIFDAGLIPENLRGSKTGVCVGACFADTVLALMQNIELDSFAQTIVAQIAYSFDFRGPAFLVDTACASSFSALHEATVMLKKSLCDQLVVSGLSVTLNPAISFGFKNMRMISDDGRSKCLDKDVNGYCRSESVISIFLQKRKHAKRIYASIVNVKTNTDGYKQEGITFPRSETQQKLMSETIKAANLNPIDINYIEAHMTGTAAGDPAESKAIIEGYRPNGNDKPLNFGCLKSNLGHTEGASGCMAITKVCLAFQKRRLPPNLNFKNPNPHIEPLIKGIIKPISEACDFNEDIVPVNSFGFGGVNVHCILKANEKSMLNTPSSSIFNDLPRIIAISGRTTDAVDFMLSSFEQNKDKLTEEYLALLNDVCKMSPKNGINGRGYMIINESGVQNKKITHIDKTKPIVLKFSSQIIEKKIDFKQLLKLKPFKESIENSREVLKTVSFDLNLNNEISFESDAERILITVLTQMAIVDTLKHLGLKSDKIIAESIGQISGDYFDECLTAKEAILIAFWISKCFENQNNLERNQQISNSLNEIIKSSRKRSSKWVNGWAGSFCSVESYTKKFYETEFLDQFIPENSFVFEITGTDITLNSMLTTFGEIFNSGCNLMLENLYPKVTYPVTRETDSLSHLWRWNHNQNWLITKFPDFFCSIKLGLKRTVDLSDQFWRMVDGHCIDKRLLFPATGYLLMIWTSVATTFDNLDYILNFSIEFKNVKFRRATIVPKIGALHFNINYIPETGNFQIIEGGSICVTGNVKVCHSSPDEEAEIIPSQEMESSSAVTLSSKEIYRELRTRGYDYGPNFRCLIEAKSDGSSAKVKWNGNWINFADSVLQLSVLEQTDRCLFIPTSIEYLKLNSHLFRKEIERAGSSEVIMDVTNINRNYSVANGAMIIKNIIGTPTSRKITDQIPDIEEIRFVPFEETISLSELKRNKVKDYTETCEKLFQTLVNRQENNNNVSIDEEQFKSIINKSSQDVSLLKMLYEMYTENCVFENGLMDKYKNEISKDFTCNLTKADLFEPFFDLVSENTFLKTMNVAEFNLSTNYLHEFLDEQYSRCQQDFNYKLMHRLPNQTNLPPDLIHLWQSEDNIASLASNIDFVIWRDWSVALLIAKDSIQEKFDLKSFLDSLSSIKAGGFLLLNFREKLSTIETQILKFQKICEPPLFSLKEVRDTIATTNFCVIGERSDELGNKAILLRKPLEQMSVDKPTVVDLNTFEYNWVEDLKTAVKISESEKIWLRAADSEFNGVIGLFSCLKREIGESRLRCIFGENVKLTEEVIKNDLAVNVFRNGVWGSLRKFNIDINEQFKSSEFAYLDVQTKGDLSSLKWHESPLAIKENNINEEDVICDVSYASLNFKDVMVASGKVPLNVYPASWSSGASIGIEFSGRDQNHNRICGVCEGGSIATKVKVNQFVWEVPSNWTLEEAATVPTVYVTVYYALFIRGKMRRNESILIHAGSGGVGQAAISVCLKMNCNIYTTVGTEEKKQFLLQRFPELKAKQIGYSRDTRFEELIMKETDGHGVDIILNSLSEEKLRASARCLADFGRFLEIGKYDIVLNSPLESHLFEKNISFHAICVAHLMDELKENQNNQNAELFKKLHSLIEKGMKNGEIKPLTRHVFQKDDYEEATRFLANGKHIGKVLIKMNDENEITRTVLRAIPQTFFSSKKSYILVGGLGGFGLEVAYWMVTRGAKHFVLTSRSGIKDNYQQFAVKRLESKGATVVILKNDATNEAKVKDILEAALNLGELGGVFIMPLILKDSLLENQTVEMFNDVCACKVNSTTLLDALTRKMKINLDYFVCFSSMVASIGNRTQTNYGFANSVMDRVCDKRRNDGLHGLSIQWGIIGDVGFVAERFDDVNLTLRGSIAQRMPSCLQTLDKLMQTDLAVCVSIVRVKENTKSTGKDDLKKQICHVLGIKNPEKVNLAATLGELGLDSLMAVEIKQTLERDFDLELSILEIRNLSLNQLMDIENNKSSSKKEKQSETSNFWDKLFQVPSSIFVKLNNQTEGLPLFFIPPVDGNFDLMLPLANLSRPVIGINWTSDLHNMSSISEVASFYAEELYKNYPQPEYELIGYSFGAVVALDLCVQLQMKYGESIVKKVILIDGSAKMLKTQLVDEIYAKNVSESDETENFWDYLSYMLKVKANDRVKHREEIRSLSTKEMKTEKIAEIVAEATGKECNAQSLSASIDIFAHKSRLLYKYETQNKFIGKAILIRAKEKSLVYDFKDYDEEDYGLSQQIHGQLNVITLKGFHETLIATNIDRITAQIEEEFTFFLV